MDVLDTFTSLAFYLATPHKFTVTPFHQGLFKRVISSPTTHKVATIHSIRPLITLAARCPQTSGRVVRLAIIRGLLEVQQIFICRLVVSFVFPLQLCATFVEFDFDGAVITFLQAFPDFSERWKLLPASLEAAGTGNPVTFAGDFCVVVYRLKHMIKHRVNNNNNIIIIIIIIINNDL